MATPNQEKTRVDWVDYAKGICIVFVVLLYATGTAESVLQSKGWIHAIGDFARAFRMPDFFLIAGLFVARVLHRSWRDYLDTKVVHFFYFYVLWLTINFVLSEWRSLLGAEPMIAIADYFWMYVQPHGQLWFIYMLPLFFIAVKASHKLPVWAVAGIAVALKLADLDTGWKMIDRFGMYFVFFYAGHVFSRDLFDFVEWMRRHPGLRNGYLLVWCGLNAMLVAVERIEVPFINLVMGLTGAIAVILVATMLASIRGMAWLRYLGEHSIVVYVGFGVPMILLRKLILSNHWINDVDIAGITLTVLSILGALAMYRAAHGTRLDFLFKRPAWISLGAPAPHQSSHQIANTASTPPGEAIGNVATNISEPHTPTLH